MAASSVRVEQRPYADSRIYHVRMELTDRGTECSTFDDAGEVCRTVARFRGVECCYVGRYSVTVVKGQAWEWAEVEAQLMPFLEAMNASE